MNDILSKVLSTILGGLIMGALALYLVHSTSGYRIHKLRKSLCKSSMKRVRAMSS